MRDGTTTSNLEVLARRQDGSRFWAGLVMAPVCSETGHIFYYVGVGADITAKLAQQREQRELQEKLYEEMRERERMAIELRLAQKLESVGRLAAGIAHEINTPIQYIGDSVSFLQSAQTDLDRLLRRIAECDSGRRRLRAEMRCAGSRKRDRSGVSVAGDAQGLRAHPGGSGARRRDRTRHEGIRASGQPGAQQLPI